MAAHISNRVRLTVVWAVGAFVLALLLAAALPLIVGDHSYVVRSGSMTPTIDTGDVVVVQSISPLQAHVGDIVTFRDPEFDNNLVNHRARAIERVGGRINFVTQGDANTGQERWSVPVNGTIGRVAYRVPKIGFAIVWITTPWGRAGFIVLPALLLMASALRRIWGREEIADAAQA